MKLTHEKPFGGFMSKITIEKGPIVKALALVGKAISNRPSHPALANYKLVIEYNTLTIQGTNLAVFVTAKIPLEPSLLPESISVLVNAKKFKSACDSSKESVAIDYLDESRELEIVTHNARFKLATTDTDEYPEFPTVQEESVEIDSFEFKKLITSVSYASSTDDTKQVLTGVNIKEFSTDEMKGLQSAATDGHRLAVFSSEIENCPKMDICIPSGLIALCKDVLPEKGLIEFAHDESHAEVTIGEGEITILGRVFTGNFPLYEQLLPQSFMGSFVISQTEMIEAIKSARIMTDEKQKLVNLSIDADDENNAVLVISSVTKEVGQAEIRVPIANVNGDINKFGFNIEYLFDSINSFSNRQEIVFHLNESDRPVMISALGGMKPQLSGALLMPVQVRG